MGLAAPMRNYDQQPLEGSDAGAPIASGFDARRRLAGEYDHFQFRHARVAQAFSGGSRGDGL